LPRSPITLRGNRATNAVHRGRRVRPWRLRTAGPASAAGPAFPDNLVVFPNRDPAFEINHPGGYCWGAGTGVNVTPDLQPAVNGVGTGPGSAACDPATPATAPGAPTRDHGGPDRHRHRRRHHRHPGHRAGQRHRLHRGRAGGQHRRRRRAAGGLQHGPARDRPRSPGHPQPPAGAGGGARTAVARWWAPKSNGGSAIIGYRVTILRMSSATVNAPGAGAPSARSGNVAPR
jgi:hypothetical protein